MHYKLYIVLQILLEEIDEGAAQVLAGAGSFADAVGSHRVAHLIEGLAVADEFVDEFLCILIVDIVVACAVHQ